MVGLSETVINILANWSCDQVHQYGNRLVLGPDLVSAWAFGKKMHFETFCDTVIGNHIG